MSLQRKNNRSSSNLVISEPYDQRRWLQRRGKESRLLFSDKMKDRLKKYFLSLDEDGSETISSNELEDPLILFGLCQNRKEVNSLFSCTYTLK
jgi:Ca2+-binding EF-hand superfamily protein